MNVQKNGIPSQSGLLYSNSQPQVVTATPVAVNPAQNAPSGTIPVVTATPVSSSQPQPQDATFSSGNYSQPGYQNNFQAHTSNQYNNLSSTNHAVQGQSPVSQTMTFNNPNNKYEFMQGRRELLIKQEFAFIEAAAQAVGMNCIEQENKYEIFDGKTGELLFYVKEKSDMLIRCCCHPNHSAKLYVHNSKHPGFNKQNLSTQMGPNTSLVMVVDKPFKFNCCLCHELCMHEQKALLASDSTVIGSANKLRPCGGYFTPIVEIKDDTKKPYAMVKGPVCCVGGLIEICSSISFNIFDPSLEKQIGLIQKKKPKGLQALQEAAGDADQFFLTIPSSFDDKKAANLLATLLLMDYIFFEGGAPFEYDAFENKCKINCFNCYFLGCVWPCHCEFGGNQESS